MRGFPRTAAALLAASLLVGCGDDVTAPVRKFSANATQARASAQTTVTIAPLADTLLVGNRVRLRATVNSHATTFARWRSLDTAVAAIDYLGVVAARRPGRARIVAGAQSDTAIIVVHAPVASLQIQPRPLEFSVGQTAQLSVQAADANGNAVSLDGIPLVWTSTAPSIVNITPDRVERI